MANNFVHRAGGAFGVRPEGTAHAQSSVDDSDRDGRGDRSRVLERIGRRPGELRRRDPTGTGRACRAARRCTRPPRARGSSCGLARRPIASSDDGKVRLLGLAVLQRARWHTRRGRRDRPTPSTDARRVAVGCMVGFGRRLAHARCTRWCASGEVPAARSATAPGVATPRALRLHFDRSARTYARGTSACELA